MKNKKKQCDQMTTAELAKATAEFDKEFIADSFSPLTPAQRAQWERMRRKPGRPRVGKGVKVISVSVEKDLLARTDRAAKRLGISRADLIARGLGAVLREPVQTRAAKRVRAPRKRVLAPD
jgi:hypothetical protein